MTDFCRCDSSIYVDGKCEACKLPAREMSTELLHKPPTITTFAPRPVIEEKPPWRICPSCGVENNEHKPRCPRANWNVDKYNPRKEPESDASYRARLLLDIGYMNTLDSYAVSTVTGTGLDVIGDHLKIPRR